MDIAASFLSVHENLPENIKKLDNTTIKYLHLDIMDGKFVPNTTWNFNEINHILQGTTKPYDVHLMVNDVKSYIEDFSKLNPSFITFHIEAVDNVEYIISYIKSKNIKVGLALSPSTDLKKIIPYLNQIDLVLIMSVEPGFGKQQFIDSIEHKIEILNNFRIENNYHYLIEVDGGINNETINKVTKADIIVVGSYITNNNNYQEQIDKLQNREV